MYSRLSDTVVSMDTGATEVRARMDSRNTTDSIWSASSMSLLSASTAPHLLFASISCIAPLWNLIKRQFTALTGPWI